MNASETTCAVGIPKNVQLSLRNVSSDEPDDAVPDEEDQQEVARAEPLAEPR